jgi:hypothetical protein
MSAHKLDDQQFYGAANIVLSSNLAEEMFLGGEFDRLLDEARSGPLLTFWKRTDPVLETLSAQGVDSRVMWRALLRLRVLEELRPRGTRRNLKGALRRVEKAKGALIKTFRMSADLRTMIRSQEAIAARIRQALEPWDRKEGKRGRGRSPQTRILVALIAYVLKVTGSKHYRELSELITACYRAAGSRISYSEKSLEKLSESLRKLWDYNPDLRKDWKSVLRGAWELHPPILGKVHAPGKRFKPPKTAVKRALGLQSRPKYVN